MKSGSMYSLESFDPYSNNANSTGGGNSGGGNRRAVIPIRELDFESRIMLHAKLPKKKSTIHDQLQTPNGMYEDPWSSNNNHLGASPTSSTYHLGAANMMSSEQQAASSYDNESQYLSRDRANMSEQFNNPGAKAEMQARQDCRRRQGQGHHKSGSKHKSILFPSNSAIDANNNNNNSAGSSGNPSPARPLGLLHKDSPLNNPNHPRHKDYRYRVWQCKIYNFLERPRGWKAGLYHILIFATVFLCLILSVLATIQDYETVASQILMYTEGVIVVWLSVELSLRVWSAGCRSRYQTLMGRLKFMKNVFCILDLTVIIASISLTIIATSQNKHKNFATAAFRGLRFFQILRMLRVDRRAGTWRLLGTVVWAHRQELITTFYIGFLSLIVSSFIMYLLEKDAHDTKITTFADSLWWGVITLCTIGYGDVYPVTWGGKLLASSCALIGISFFALPAGILGSGFALKVQAMQRQKHLNRRRAPAATLIQSIWRCYAADPNSLSIATWKVHLKAIAVHHHHTQQTASLNFHHNASSPALNPHHINIPEYSIANLARPYIGQNSFLNRVASLKRRTPPIGADNSTAPKQTGGNDTNPGSGGSGGSRRGYVKTNSLAQIASKNGNNDASGSNSEFLTSRRDAIVIPGLFNASTSVYNTAPNSNPDSNPNNTPSNVRRQDEVTDVQPQAPIESDPLLTTQESDPSSTGGGPHFSVGDYENAKPARSNTPFILALQQFPSRAQESKITPVKSSFAHRTLNFLSELNTNKTDHDDLEANQAGANSGHKSKHLELTLQQKTAIRAIRKIKYFVARRKFREALRPYDVTDVIEQYSAGNLDMLARIKTLQFRLDKILGSSKAKDCYDSSTISLASRIVKVERQVDDMELKFDKFFSSYTIDMKIIIEKLSSFPSENYIKYIQSQDNQVSVIAQKSSSDDQKSNILHRRKLNSIYSKSKAKNSNQEFELDEDEMRLISLQEQQRSLSKKIELIAANIYRKNNLSSLDQSYLYEMNDHPDNLPGDYYEDYVFTDDEGDDYDDDDLNPDDELNSELEYQNNFKRYSSGHGDANNDNLKSTSVFKQVRRNKKSAKNAASKSTPKTQSQKPSIIKSSLTLSRSDFALKSPSKRMKDKKAAIKKYLLNAIFQQQKFRQEIVTDSNTNLSHMQKYKSDSHLWSSPPTSSKDKTASHLTVSEAAAKKMASHSSSSRFLEVDDQHRLSATDPQTSRNESESPSKQTNFKFGIDFKNLRKKLDLGRKAIKKRSFYQLNTATSHSNTTSQESQIPLIRVDPNTGAAGATDTASTTLTTLDPTATTSFCHIELVDEKSAGEKTTDSHPSEKN